MSTVTFALGRTVIATIRYRRQTEVIVYYSIMVTIEPTIHRIIMHYILFFISFNSLRSLER